MGKKLLLKIQTTPVLSRCNSYKKFREKMKSRAIIKEDWRKLATECCIWIIFLVYLKTCKFILNIFCNIEQAKKPCVKWVQSQYERTQNVLIPFMPLVLFYTPRKHVSDVFRWLRKKPVTLNGLVAQLVVNKAKRRILKRRSQENKARQIFRKNYNFLPLDTHTYACVSGGKKSLFFGKFDVLCFLVTSVLRFPFLPYYRRILVFSQLYWKKLTHWYGGSVVALNIIFYNTKTFPGGK